MENVSEQEVDLTFVLDPKPKITEICFVGNRNLRTRSLFKQIEAKVGDPLSEAILNSDLHKVKEYYYKSGYSCVDIRYSIDTDPCSGSATVKFCIDEGLKTRVAKIKFCGIDPIKASKLKGVMETKEWWIFSFISKKGRFRDDVFREDIYRLREYFRDQGYLDVEIKDSDIYIENPTPATICITINVNRGPCYRVGTVTISNNKLFSSECLCPLLCVHEGDVFSPSMIEGSEAAIQSAYGEIGYLDTYVVAERKPNVDTSAIDLEFVVHESGKYYVESIKVQGNTKTKSTVILRELALEPGDIFDLTRMRASEARLRNTNFFDDVNLIPEDTNIPGRRNMLIAVKEGRTGNLQFGLSFSSLEQFVGSVEVSQSNFDIMNYRNGFQGAGQKFRIRTRLGKRSNSVTLSFEEPWVCERELAFGVNIYRNEASYVSSNYDEVRQGFNVYFRKRLWGLIDGHLGYGFEDVNIKNVNEKTSKHIKGGRRTVSKIFLALSYDTRDELIYPTCGTNINVSGDVAGGVLGGETKYVRLEAQAAQWFPISDVAKQVLLVGGATGTIMPYGNQTIPIFDRFFLGGPDNLRGFDYRQVGPKDLVDPSKEPLGGNTSARATAEYSFRVFDPVRFVVFYDIGFVNVTELNWSPHAYNDNWGVGLRIFILNAPLRLDWGFPIHGDGINDKKKMQFHFSFGTTF